MRLPKPRPSFGLTAARLFVGAWALFFAFMSLWALASPLMAAPDEPAHAIKAAAVVRGQWLGQSSSVQGEALRVTVPEYVAKLHDAPSCYAFRADLSASCELRIRDLGTEPVEATTTAGNYNPLYYAVVGLPTLVLTGEKAIYGMRLVTALWCSALFALSLALAHLLWMRRLPLVVMGVGVTPMCLFLAGTINPNAVEIATTLCAFVSAYAMCDRRFPHPLLASLVFGLSSLTLANLRPLSIVWLLTVFAGAIILQWRRDLITMVPRATWLGLSLAVLGVGLGLAWQSFSNSFDSLLGSGVKDTPPQVLSVMLERSFDYARQYVGVMGWLDTGLPTVTYVVWDAVAGAILVGCLAIWRGRRRLAVLLLMAVILVLPAAVQVPAAPQVGYIWQGRYILPLVVVLFAVGGIALESVNLRTRVSRNVLRLALGSLAFVNTYGFLWVLRRYVTGLRPDLFWDKFFLAPQWQPPGGSLALTGLYAVVSVAAAVGSMRYLASTSQAATSRDARGPAFSSAGPPAESVEAGESR